jgi:hypothetical protein
LPRRIGEIEKHLITAAKMPKRMSAAATALAIAFISGNIPTVIAFPIVLPVIMLAGAVKKLILVGLAVLFIAMLGFSGFSGYQLYAALSDTSGPVDSPDPAILAFVTAKFDAVGDTVGFHVVVTDGRTSCLYAECRGSIG